MQSDLAFLKEMKQKFEDGFYKNDPTLVQFGIEMIDDWIHDIENTDRDQTQQKLIKSTEALQILKDFCHVRDDMGAYLFSVIEWGLGEEESKPDPKQYGII